MNTSDGPALRPKDRIPNYLAEMEKAAILGAAFFPFSTRHVLPTYQVPVSTVSQLDRLKPKQIGVRHHAVSRGKAVLRDGL